MSTHIYKKITFNSGAIGEAYPSSEIPLTFTGYQTSGYYSGDFNVGEVIGSGTIPPFSTTGYTGNPIIYNVLVWNSQVLGIWVYGGSGYVQTVEIRLNGSQLALKTLDYSFANNSIFFFVYDDANSTLYFHWRAGGKDNTGCYYSDWGFAFSSNDGALAKQILDNAEIPVVEYIWQSVPSISGKNGILTLSTLNDVNDGEPVETSDTSKFNLTDDSNVSALVAARLSE